MDKCRSCGRRITWARTAAGKAMPLDPEPDTEAGNVYLRTTDASGKALGFAVADVLGGQALEASRSAGDELWVPHFATCSSWPRRRG